MDPVIVTLVDAEGKETLLAYSKFKPDSPEKFPRGIDGIVISHINNNLDPNSAYKIKLSFKNGHVYCESVKEILPVSSVGMPEAIKPVDAVHVYAYDYANHKWVPLPVDQKLMVGQ